MEILMQLIKYSNYLSIANIFYRMFTVKFIPYSEKYEVN